MDASRLDKLTDRQKECLRLVFENYEAKEIALKLGILPNRVIEDLRAARKKLGASRSMDAARLARRARGIQAACTQSN